MKQALSQLIKKKKPLEKLTRSELRCELILERMINSEALEHARKMEIANQEMIITNEKLRAKILENTQLILRNSAYKAMLERRPGDDRKLRLHIEFDESVYRYFSPQEYAEQVAQQVRYEILRKWPDVNLVRPLDKF